MPIPTPLLLHATRTVAELRPRGSNTPSGGPSNGLTVGGDVGSILGGMFGGLALLAAVVFGIWEIRRAKEEDARLDNKWYKKLGRKLRKLMFWR